MRVHTSSRKSDQSGVSFIVPAFNAEKTLSRCLDAIRAQTFSNSEPYAVEIIVVDDGSSDDTSAVAASHGAIVVQQENSGAARARNQGLLKATYEAVAFIDADVVISENWAGQCLLTLETPWIDCVQTPVVPDGPAGFMTTFRRDFIGYKTQGHYCYLVNAKESAPVLNSSAFMSRRSYLKDCAYAFDENLRRGEDLDFSLQLFFGGCHFAVASAASARVYDERSAFRYLMRSFQDGRWTFEVLRAWNIDPKPLRRKRKLRLPPSPISALFIRLNLAATRLGLFVSSKGLFRINSRKSEKRPPGPDYRNPFLLRVEKSSLKRETRLILLADELIFASARDLSRLTLNKQQSETVKNLIATTMKTGHHERNDLRRAESVLALLMTHGFMSEEA